MREQPKTQKARLSTEAVMTPAPSHGNADNSVAGKSREQVIDGSIDKPISDAHKDYDTDLARDNLENDNTAADLQDL